MRPRHLLSALAATAVAAASGSVVVAQAQPDEIVRAVGSLPVWQPGTSSFLDDLPGPIGAVARAVRDALSLLVNNPVQFALLFATFALLAAPRYLAYRRRSFARALMGGGA
jgi:hypothetical protein